VRSRSNASVPVASAPLPLSPSLPILLSLASQPCLLSALLEGEMRLFSSVLGNERQRPCPGREGGREGGRKGGRGGDEGKRCKKRVSAKEGGGGRREGERDGYRGARLPPDRCRTLRSAPTVGGAGWGRNPSYARAPPPGDAGRRGRPLWKEERRGACSAPL
jgi:hypothetical protein